MKISAERAGHYACDSFLTSNGRWYVRIKCVERQRNQAIAALEELSNAASMTDLAIHPANVKACEVIMRLKGGAHD
jgi:hypothetical protein